MPPDHEGMIFVFTGFAERQACPFEPHVSWGVGATRKIWVQPPFSAKNRALPGARTAMLYRTSALRTARHEFNAHPPSAGRREMGSGTSAFNPRDPHGPYARRSYRTARESGATSNVWIAGDAPGTARRRQRGNVAPVPLFLVSSVTGDRRRRLRRADRPILTLTPFFRPSFFRPCGTSLQFFRARIARSSVSVAM